MSNCIFHLAGHTSALRYAADILNRAGYVILRHPDRSVTHLLLPVPSFEADGRIKGGGDLGMLLRQLSSDVIIFGGHLERPELAGYQTVDLLQDPWYVTENASITAYCAIRLALVQLPVTLKGCPVLVVGWGRIGKCLARLLKQMDACVTVAARKATDRALLEALHYHACDTQNIDPSAYRIIFNTAPTMLLPQCPETVLKIDLASQPGIGGPDVIWARGLPGKDAPESSGMLIAQTVIRIISEKESSI